VVTFVRDAVTADTAVTNGPDLVNAEFVRTTNNDGTESTTVRYTFDEAVIAGVDEEKREFEAARDAVLGTVEAGAVTDDEGTDNPEGAEVIAGA
jgi:hypothetical protein